MRLEPAEQRHLQPQETLEPLLLRLRERRVPGQQGLPASAGLGQLRPEPLQVRLAQVDLPAPTRPHRLRHPLRQQSLHLGQQLRERSGERRTNSQTLFLDLHSGSLCQKEGDPS
ncbi:hypothetical protein E2320_014226 [Naja naja]|nr:hypothetical protein E2320_014226 [Naja naja]